MAKKKAAKKKPTVKKKRPRLDYVQNALRVVRAITDGESKL
jgi:hypothetical protein